VEQLAALADRGSPADLEGHARPRSPAVSLTGVTRLFDRSPALLHVDLRIERGHVVLLRGPNGAGKTSLLRVIATAISPTYGGGSILGFDLLGQRFEIRARTELLGHRSRLYDDLTAAENLRFVCELNGLAPRGVPAALETVGLGAAADERVRGFSQGMRQRVALARLLLRRAELLLLDEPYAGLDDEGKDLVDRLILEAAGGGRTVVVATHDATRSSIAGFEVQMDAGRVVGMRQPR